MLSQCVHGSGYVGDPPHPFVSTSELLNLQVGSLDSGTAWQTPDSSDVADSAPVAPYRSRPTPLLVVPVSAMSGHPPTVTEALSKIHLKVTAPGPLPPAEDFAPLFRDLDLVWRSTHTQELSTPAFILHLSNYVMIQERVTPSSQEGASIKDTVGSIARVRLGLLVSQGTTYGAELRQAASDQGREIQTGDRSETQATDRLPPSERLMALNMALETYEHIMRTGAVLSQALADVGNLNPPSSRPGKAPQKSPVWYAELRTTVPGSARFTGVRPAENVAELDMAASHRLQRSAVIHQLLSGMSADGHYCSRGSARPGPCLGPATEVLGRSCPLQVQDGSYAHGPCGTLIATLTCSQGQKSSRSADYNKTHPMPVHHTWQVNPPRSEVSSPPPEDRDASSVPSSSERNTAGVSQTSARHAAETQDKATARPRPTMASGLRAVATSRSAPCQGNISLGPERRADASYDIGGSQTGVPSTAPLHSAYYDEADADMASPEPSDVADGIQMGTGGSEDASPQSRPSVDRDPAGTPSSMAWPNPTEEDDIDFRFGAHEGHAELDRQRPTGVTLQRMRGRPKAVTKLLVRSGLRCHKCHLKTWVCLCDRAPVELNNRGEGPRKFDLHMSSHSLRQYAVATPNYLVAGTSHDAHSGRAKALHGRRWAAIPVISAESHYALLPAGRIPAAILAHRPLAEYLFKQHCLATLHPNPRLTNSLPIRGPKSALEPYHTLLSSLVAGKLQGVRVSPLSAGGGGLCRAQPEFPSRPGKQAEGIHKQLGFSPVSYFFVNPPNSPRRPDGSVPWGHKFRLWKFRYKVVKRRKKMSVRLRETRDQATHKKKGNQAKARQIAARKIAPRRPDARSGMRTIQGAPRSLRLLIILLSCPPANCVRIEPGQPGNMHPLHIRVGLAASPKTGQSTRLCLVPGKDPLLKWGPVSDHRYHATQPRETLKAGG